MFPLQNLDKIALHIYIDVAVAIEGATAFGVAGESGYEVRILDQPGHKIGDSSFLEECLDADVIHFRGVEKQELITRKAGIYRQFPANLKNKNKYKTLTFSDFFTI